MVKKFWLFVLLVLYFTITYILLNYFNITCVFLKFAGVPCPGCGMTRALMAIVKMNIVQAIKYNVVIFFMPYIFMYLFFDFKHKIHTILLTVIAVITVINWITKIILYF